MSSQDFSPVPSPSLTGNGIGARLDTSAAWLPQARRPRRLWLHIILFLLTLFSTTVVGARMQHNFQRNLPFFDIEHDLDAFFYGWMQPGLILNGLPFSLTLLTILMAHEFGHYLACVYYRVDASLPYFLPAPTFTGTFGAFIRIRSPIYAKRILFDIGIAGPIAGFVFLLPALSIGLAFSKVIPGIGYQGSLTFGTPPLLWVLQQAILPGVNSADIYLHPIARAAWVGIFATALNLLPVGQLDGGHILYSLAGDKHKLLSRIFVVVLVPIGVFFWYGWLVWAVILFFFGMRHPVIYDYSAIGRGRSRLGLLALAIFLLCFTVAPIATTG